MVGAGDGAGVEEVDGGGAGEGGLRKDDHKRVRKGDSGGCDQEDGGEGEGSGGGGAGGGTDHPSIHRHSRNRILIRKGSNKRLKGRTRHNCLVHIAIPGDEHKGWHREDVLDGLGTG